MRPMTPQCSSVPRPLAPMKPVACESSTMTSAPYLSARSQISRKGAMLPSIENTPSVAMSRVRQSCVSFEMLLELGEIAVRVAQPPRLAEPDAVDDARVIQRVGDDRVVLAEHGFEQPAVRIPARRIEDRVLRAQETRQRRLELFVHGLRAADEAHRRHAVAVPVDGAVRRLADRRVAREPEVVVSAEVDDVGVVGADLPALGARDHAFGLEQALLAQLVELGVESLVEGRCPRRNLG